MSLPFVFWLNQWSPVMERGAERNWSTYCFIVDKRRNWVSVDCGRKLEYAHFNVRLLRMVCAVEYHSEYLAWEDEDEVEIDTEVLEVEDEVAE